MFRSEPSNISSVSLATGIARGSVDPAMRHLGVARRAVYVFIPFNSFQFWASALPVGLIIIFVYAFSQTGAF